MKLTKKEEHLWGWAYDMDSTKPTAITYKDRVFLRLAGEEEPSQAHKVRKLLHALNSNKIKV